MKRCEEVVRAYMREEGGGREGEEVKRNEEVVRACVREEGGGEVGEGEMGRGKR